MGLAKRLLAVDKIEDLDQLAITIRLVGVQGKAARWVEE